MQDTKEASEMVIRGNTMDEELIKMHFSPQKLEKEKLETLGLVMQSFSQRGHRYY